MVLQWFCMVLHGFPSASRGSTWFCKGLTWLGLENPQIWEAKDRFGMVFPWFGMFLRGYAQFLHSLDEFAVVLQRFCMVLHCSTRN